MKPKIFVISFVAALYLLSSCQSDSKYTKECLDFQAISDFPQVFSGPTFVIDPLIFTNPVRPNGTFFEITLEDRGEDSDGKPELFIPYSSESNDYKPLFIEMPGCSTPEIVQLIEVTLMHFHSAKIVAINSDGNTVSSATADPEGSKQIVRVCGADIHQIKFIAQETLVYKICWMCLNE